MKKVAQNLLALAFRTKVHATHTAIKGSKSGGTRDSDGKDWKNTSGSLPKN